MPILLNDSPAGRGSKPAIEVGLLNNMPDAALESTERQFFDLLDAAADERLVRVTLYSLPDVPRSDAARSYLAGRYRSVDELFGSRLDGLIVTGTEPIANTLKNEPYWAALTRVIDWADANTSSSIWSCLAAHAAVLHLDGIGRHPLPEKKCGMFDCTRVDEHPLLDETPSHMRIPHSRCNDLWERELVAHGYQVLTRSLDAGVDLFVKERNSLFVFFQGHPEYDPRALMREYRRDVARFLRGQRPSYPGMPRSYFDRSTVDVLNAYRERAHVNRSETAIDDFPASLAERSLMPMVGSAAAGIYANWLSILADRKVERSKSTAPAHRSARPLPVA